MIDLKTMLVASVAAVTTGAAFAELSIARECDSDEGRGNDGFFVGARWVTTNAPRRLTNEFPPANPL